MPFRQHLPIIPQVDFPLAPNLESEILLLNKREAYFDFSIINSKQMQDLEFF